MHCNTVTNLCVVLVATAVAVTGKPHQCFLDEYARALLAQYYPGEVTAAMAEAAKPVAMEYEEPTACRSGRSNDRAPPAVPVPEPVVMAKPVVPAAKSILVDEPMVQTQGSTNDTTSVNTVQKLSAYYDQLKAQQEDLVREQLQAQLYAQQRSRQQDFALTVQQMQQQYYQQQQHTLLMLDQLHKNPGFIGHVSAFNALAASNGTGVLPQAASGVVLSQAEAPVAATVVKSSPPVAEALPTENDDKVTAKQAVADDPDEDECDDKHLETRQATVEDDQTPPVLEKVYSMMAE